MYMCMHMCVYVHFAIPSPILKLASLALHPPILKSFLRLCYMYFIARNSIFEYWEITSPASTQYAYWATIGPHFNGVPLAGRYWLGLYGPRRQNTRLGIRTKLYTN